MGRRTEDVGVFEVDGFVLEGVGRVDECLTLAVELDSVGGLVDAVRLHQFRLELHLFTQHAHILLVHVLDVADRRSDLTQ